MKQIISAAFASMVLAVAVTDASAQTNTNTSTGGPFWVQNANFTLVSQSSSGKATFTSKTLVQDLSGAIVTTSGGVVVTSTPSATITNPAFLALGAGQDYFTNGASITNMQAITFTNGETTNITIVSTQTGTNPPTYTFTNFNVTSTNNETVSSFTNTSLPAGPLTAVLVGTNPAVFTISGAEVVTTNVSESVTNPTFGRTAKLIIKSPSPSGAVSDLGQFFVREGSNRNPKDTDVSAFFPNAVNLIIAASKGNGTVEDFNLGFTGRTKSFDTRGSGSSNVGSNRGASQRRSLNSTLVGSGTNNGAPIVITGKFTLSGGAVEQ